MTDLTIEQRVAAGAQWLDENRSGWVEVIDLAELDLSNPRLCILGQLYNNYWSAPLVAYPFRTGGVSAKEKQDKVAALGLNAHWKGDPNDELPECVELDVAWHDLITARRAAVPA